MKSNSDPQRTQGSSGPPELVPPQSLLDASEQRRKPDRGSRLWVWGSLGGLVVSVCLICVPLFVSDPSSAEASVIGPLLAVTAIGFLVSLVVSLFDLARRADSSRTRRWSRWSAWSLTFLPIIVMGGLVVYGIARGPSEDSIATAVLYEDLALELDRAVEWVPVPPEWEVDYLRRYSSNPSVGYTLSPDLSSSGTRMHIWVADLPEDAFWRELEATISAKSGAALVEAPVPTSLSGVPGHLFEVSGLVGNKTGQELGAYWAVFFGPEYTYVVVTQYELPDRDDMSLVWRETLTQLSIPEGPNEV